MNTPQNHPALSFEKFIAFLRSALHYLYDPVHLRRSPLVETLGQSTAADQASALQRVLTDSINSLKPSEDEPPQSTAWMIYDILNLQNIRQYDRTMVASQLGISERQLRREQRLALEALARYLWQKFDLEDAATAPQLPASQDQTVAENPGDLTVELSWLKNSPIEEQGALHETLHAVQELANPLAEQYAVTLRLRVDPLLEGTPVPQASFRSILLTMLNAMIPRMADGALDIIATRAGQEIQIKISAEDTRLSLDAVTQEIDLDTARKLAAFYGVDLDENLASPRFSATLHFNVPEQIPILVIDDNADWLEMLKRYAVGTHYQVVTTRDSRSAAALAEKIQPAVIFLDVMMPNVDGWQVLSELRQGQATHYIPLVVCTVLPLANLALSLGVNNFLQKPITQEQFLRAIQEQINKNR